MLKIISHRGNIDGKTEKENKPSYIENAISLNYDVEIDVWLFDNRFYLGHDEPQYLVDEKFLHNPRLWCHAKNIEALEIMHKNNIHCFWHDIDKLTFTSKSVPWCYPGVYVKSGITVELGTHKIIPSVYGVCTDYPSSWIDWN